MRCVYAVRRGFKHGVAARRQALQGCALQPHERHDPKYRRALHPWQLRIGNVENRQRRADHGFDRRRWEGTGLAHEPVEATAAGVTPADVAQAATACEVTPQAPSGALGTWSFPE